MILDETAKYLSLAAGDLMSKSRSRPLTQARHIAMYLTRECTGLSLLKIGEIFGGRDHATVLHGIRKVEDEMQPATPPSGRSRIRRASGAVRGVAVMPGSSDVHNRGHTVCSCEVAGDLPGTDAFSPVSPHVGRDRYAAEMAALCRFPQRLLPPFFFSSDR